MVDQPMAEQARGADGPMAGPEPLKGFISGQTFELREVQYSDVNGLALFEGDIVLGTAEELARSKPPRATDEGEGSSSSGTGPVVVGRRWPDARIPYRIDPSLRNKERVRDAVAHWNASTHALRFVETTDAGLSEYPGYIERVRLS